MKNPSTHPAFEADLKAFLDGELPASRRFQIRRHLQSCPQCREEIRIMQTIQTELKEETAPLGEDLRAKILENAPVGESTETPVVARKPSFRLTPKLVFGMGSLAVLAAMMLLPTFGHLSGRGGSADNPMPDSMSAPMAGSQSSGVTSSSAGSAGTMKEQSASDATDNYAAKRRSMPSAGRGYSDSLSSTSQSVGGGNRIYLDGVVPDQRAVHKQGSLSVMVDDAEAKGSATEILIKNAGGFVAQNALSTAGDGRKTATLDVRVPVDKFETVVAKIGKLGAVREKSVNGEDITQRVTVAGAQRESLARELSIREAQLRALSPKKAAQRASIVADVRGLRFQANQARAQLEYLKKYAALATLYVTLQDKAKPAPVVGATSELNTTARAAWSSFLTTAQLPLQLILWILAYAPLWLPALLIWKKWGRKWMSAA